MKQPLDRFFSEKIDSGRGNFILCRVFSGHGAEALRKRNRNDINEFQRLIDVSPGKVEDIVPQVAAACAERPVAFKVTLNLLIGKACLLRQKTPVVIRIDRKSTRLNSSHR